MLSQDSTLLYPTGDELAILKAASDIPLSGVLRFRADTRQPRGFRLLQMLRPSFAAPIVKKALIFLHLENCTMRLYIPFAITLSLFLGFAATAPAKSKLELVDEGLPLQELRPLDRRVYILTLDGKWNQAAPVETCYVNFIFPNGACYSHKIEEADLFRKGEVRCIIQGPQLIRNHIDSGGKFTIVVSAGRDVTSASAPEVISNALQESWPMRRQVSKFRTRTKYTELPPVDAFPIPGESPPPRPPGTNAPPGPRTSKDK